MDYESEIKIYYYYYYNIALGQFSRRYKCNVTRILEYRLGNSEGIINDTVDNITVSTVVWLLVAPLDVLEDDPIRRRRPAAIMT